MTKIIMVADALRDAAARLGPVSETPRLDAELLMAHALGTDRQGLLLRHMRDPVPDTFAALVERRASHEPVAYITGETEFWTIRLHVGPGVLIPRSDSETLIEAAIAHFVDRSPTHILDLGTGPGTLLLAALAQWPQAHGLGIDEAENALIYAERNAHDLEMTDRARFRIGDWTHDLHGQFDLILCNPPYIETDAALDPQVRDHEPPGALFAGADGLEDYRQLIPELPALLAENGVAVVELGAGQYPAVAALAEAAGLCTAARADLAGHARAMILTRINA